MRFFFSWPLGVSDLANNMHRYVQAMERQIEVLVQKQHAITQTATSEVEHDMQYMLLGEMEETFPRNLRYGTLVTIYATVEQSIRSACYLTGEVVGGPFTEPKRGGMLEGAAAYLARTLGVQIIKDRITWTPVKALRTLRHCIAHTAGHVPSATHPERVRCAMRAFTFDLMEGSDGYLEIPREALPSILDAARGWLDEVVSECWREFVTRGGLEERGGVAIN